MLAALAHPQLVERLCVVDVAPVAYSSASEFERFVAAMRGLDLDALATRDEADAGLVERRARSGRARLPPAEPAPRG